MQQKINGESRQREPKTVIDTPNTEKQEQSNRNEQQNINNRNTTQPNHTELTQKEEMNVVKLKRIKSEKKTRLPSLRNQDR